MLLQYSILCETFAAKRKLRKLSFFKGLYANPNIAFKFFLSDLTYTQTVSSFKTEPIYQNYYKQSSHKYGK